jgi:hypothetical protein
MIRREVTAAALLQQTKEGYVVSKPETIRIGCPVVLLLPDGQVVSTSKVSSWSSYGGFRITTAHTEYHILCSGI